jgi:hypothetical protein
VPGLLQRAHDVRADEAASAAGHEHPHGAHSGRRSAAARAEAGAVPDRWDTGRTEAFSDGVFAIAITLLVLDIGVPRSEFDDLWGAIWHEWPGYFGYATSFLTIGGIWLAHHGIFGGCSS